MDIFTRQILKINFDVEINIKKRLIGIGVVVSDSEGVFKWVLQKSLVYNWDAEISEAAVVLEVVRMVQER